MVLYLPSVHEVLGLIPNTTVAYTHNPSTGKGEPGGSEVPAALAALVTSRPARAV